MKKVFVPFAIIVSLLVLFNNCGGFQGKTNGVSSFNFRGAANAIPVNVTQWQLPLVSVTICVPNTKNCQTIDNILLDTGSTGLRISTAALNLSLTPMADSSGHNYAECYPFLDGTGYWGQVSAADVTLGQLTAKGLRVQLVNPNFASVPASCSDSGSFRMIDPVTEYGFNGTMGVSPYELDCVTGGNCTPTSSSVVYYTCAGTTCTTATVPASVQLQNPISSMPTDNNGYFLQLPSVPDQGSATVAGALVMGIGTRANNAPPAGVTSLPYDANGMFSTTFAGSTLPFSFIDSGSSDMMFPPPTAPSITVCDLDPGGTAQIWYCPATTLQLSATLKSGTNQVGVTFRLVNAQTVNNSSNLAFDDIADPGETSVGGTSSSAQIFDWGIPFFYGRTIYYGMEGSSVTNFGQGPLVGF
jgi:hypothetical protein